ncbi:MAG: response regulator [Sedimentibacter sp.]|uniref:response regulator n=1 Tax=Sedimentibacter sp. TaxID=1960295 RepID=UPI0029817FA5|nr:response regulator [Sedimentibacter sp.]MDW5299790.1 response regulator [Sedimentibacter sp.]
MSKILIVDDSILSRKKLRIILEEANYEIVGEAGNGAEALKKYEDLLPDLVTMDITMPDVDGISALKDIIKYDSLAKVVMVTALGKGETILEALNAGAKNFITKPFSCNQVLNSIQEALR